MVHQSNCKELLSSATILYIYIHIWIGLYAYIWFLYYFDELGFTIISLKYLFSFYERDNWGYTGYTGSRSQGGNCPCFSDWCAIMLSGNQHQQRSEDVFEHKHVLGLYLFLNNLPWNLPRNKHWNSLSRARACPQRLIAF